MTHDYALCMDIEEFFPSIKEDTVKEVFARAGYSRRAANALADMCCYFGALPQGAPTSPYLANLVFIMSWLFWQNSMMQRILDMQMTLLFLPTIHWAIYLMPLIRCFKIMASV